MDWTGIISDDQLCPGDQRDKLREMSFSAQVGQSTVPSGRGAAEETFETGLFGDAAADEEEVVKRPGPECFPRLGGENDIGAFPADASRSAIPG